MPTIAFCALDQAYGDWGPKKNENSQKKLIQDNPQKNDLEVPKELANIGSGAGAGAEALGFNPYQNETGIRSFCPYCQNCLNMNDTLQQKIIDQNIWPRPRWVPQYPHAYESGDPYNRYWAQNKFDENSRREDFTNLLNVENFGKNNGDQILQLILVVLIVLFVIQIFELIFKSVKGE